MHDSDGEIEFWCQRCNGGIAVQQPLPWWPEELCGNCVWAFIGDGSGNGSVDP